MSYCKTCGTNCTLKGENITGTCNDYVPTAQQTVEPTVPGCVLYKSDTINRTIAELSGLLESVENDGSDPDSEARISSLIRELCCPIQPPTAQQTVEPTVPWWYWVKLPLTRSFVLEISKEDIERKYILVRLGDGGKEIVHFEKIKFSGPIQPPEGWEG